MRIVQKSALVTALVAVATLGLAFGGAAAANASPKVQKTIISQGGSDTTYFAMTAEAKLYNKAQSAVSVTEIPPNNNTSIGFPASVTVPADPGCPKVSPYNHNGSRTWDSSDAAHTPPNGSSAGISALQNDDASATPGCALDMARASRALGNPSDTPDLESYAFALDALSWSIQVGGAHPNAVAPSTLSVSQLQGIYTCFTSGPNAGSPKFTNWKQVGGKSGAIIKYAPQTGSGTISFFQTTLLGGDTVDAGCDASHMSHYAEENQAATRCTNNDPTCLSGFEPIPTKDLSHMIIPFGYANWQAQKNSAHSHEHDARNGFVLQKMEGILPGPKTINEGGAGKPHFLGTRYVYNILTQNEPQYAATAAFAGINQNTLANGYLCQDSDSTARAQIVKSLKVYGDTPLTDAVEGSGEPTGYCRFDPTPV